MAVRVWKAKRASTRFIRVPTRYWSEVVHGQRREFRILDRQSTRPDTLTAPSVIVAWRRLGDGYESRLMVLERVWRERLGEISPESLEAEGHFGSNGFQSFRHEWVERSHRRFDLMQEVWCVRLRLFGEFDAIEFGKLAFIHLANLYEEHLPQGVAQVATEMRDEYKRDLRPA